MLGRRDRLAGHRRRDREPGAAGPGCRSNGISRGSLSRLTEALTGSRTELNLTPATVERVVRTALRLAHRRDLIATCRHRRASRRPASGCRSCRAPGPPPATTGCWHPVTRPGAAGHLRPGRAAGRPSGAAAPGAPAGADVPAAAARRTVAGRGAPGASVSRVTARVVPGDLLRSPAVVAHGRVVITGAEGTRLHEEIVIAGGAIEAGRLTRARQDELERVAGRRHRRDAGRAGAPTAAPSCGRSLAEPLGRALATRANQRARSLHGLLAQRCEEEVSRDRGGARRTGDLDPAGSSPTSRTGSSRPVRRWSSEQLHADRDALRAPAATTSRRSGERETERAAPPLRRPDRPLVPRRRHLPGARRSRPR